LRERGEHPIDVLLAASRLGLDIRRHASSP
jgi:hypothetical protein